MNLENKIEAQRKRMEQEKNKLDMLMKKVKIEQRKADNHRKIVVGANFETFLNEPRRYSEEQTDYAGGICHKRGQELHEAD